MYFDDSNFNSTGFCKFSASSLHLIRPIYLWFFSDADSSFDCVTRSVIIIGKNVDRIICDILHEVPFGRLSTRTEQNHERPKLAHPISVLRCEPGTSQMHVRSVVTIMFCP
jgi:hypothetical protein